MSSDVRKRLGELALKLISLQSAVGRRIILGLEQKGGIPPVVSSQVFQWLNDRSFLSLHEFVGKFKDKILFIPPWEVSAMLNMFTTDPNDGGSHLPEVKPPELPFLPWSAEEINKFMKNYLKDPEMQARPSSYPMALVFWDPGFMPHDYYRMIGVTAPGESETEYPAFTAGSRDLILGEAIEKIPRQRPRWRMISLWPRKIWPWKIEINDKSPSFEELQCWRDKDIPNFYGGDFCVADFTGIIAAYVLLALKGWEEPMKKLLHFGELDLYGWEGDPRKKRIPFSIRVKPQGIDIQDIRGNTDVDRGNLYYLIERKLPTLTIT